MVGYMNPDGLWKKYGTEKAVPNIGGEYRTVGALREVEFKIDLTKVGTSATILSDVTFAPKWRIEEVEIVTQTVATSGGSAVLNIGFVQADRTTELDFDGLVAALAITAYDTAGEKTVIRKGSTGAGALIGTTLSQTGYFCADWDTAAFTAGVLYVRVRFTAQ